MCSDRNGNGFFAYGWKSTKALHGPSLTAGSRSFSKQYRGSQRLKRSQPLLYKNTELSRGVPGLVVVKVEGSLSVKCFRGVLYLQVEALLTRLA